MSLFEPLVSEPVSRVSVVVDVVVHTVAVPLVICPLPWKGDHKASSGEKAVVSPHSDSPLPPALSLAGVEQGAGLWPVQAYGVGPRQLHQLPAGVTASQQRAFTPGYCPVNLMPYCQWSRYHVPLACVCGDPGTTRGRMVSPQLLASVLLHFPPGHLASIQLFSPPGQQLLANGRCTYAKLCLCLASPLT